MIENFPNMPADAVPRAMLDEAHRGNHKLATALAAVEAQCALLRAGAEKWLAELDDMFSHAVRESTGAAEEIDVQRVALRAALDSGAGQRAIVEIAGARGVLASTITALRMESRDYLVVNIATGATPELVAGIIRKTLAGVQPKPAGLIVLPATVRVEALRLPAIKEKLMTMLGEVAEMENGHGRIALPGREAGL